MKFYPHVQRRDAAEDHIHALPSGAYTGGCLYKPSPDRFGWHTHLYEMDGRVYETSPDHEGAGHVHMSELGETSGPTPALKTTAKEVAREKNDSKAS